MILQKIKKAASLLFSYKNKLLNRNAFFRVYLLGAMKTQVDKFKKFIKYITEKIIVVIVELHK